MDKHRGVGARRARYTSIKQIYPARARFARHAQTNDSTIAQSMLNHGGQWAINKQTWWGNGQSIGKHGGQWANQCGQWAIYGNQCGRGKNVLVRHVGKCGKMMIIHDS